MFDKSKRASLLFMVVLTLGLVTITLWNVAAYQAFFDWTSYVQLSEVLETTIYQAICSIFFSICFLLTIRQLIRKKRWYYFAFDFLFFALCIAGAAFIIYHSDDHKAFRQIFNTFFNDLNLHLELVTNPELWSHSVAEGLWSLNWIWYQALVLCLLATSVFLIFPLVRKARENGQKRRIGLALCLGLPLTLIVDNLENLSHLHSFFLPDPFYGLIGFLWDAAPFLGLSTLALALLAREQNRPLPRKAWWVAFLITMMLSLDLVAMVAEIRDILANALQIDTNTSLIHMQFWPTLPITALSALSITILAMIAALMRERRTTRVLASLPLANVSVEERAEQLEKKSAPAGMAAETEFEVEITDL